FVVLPPPFRTERRGVSRSSRHVERNAVDGDGPVDERHIPGRRSGVVLAPRKVRRQVADDASRIVGCDGGKREGSPRRAPISRKPLRREGRLSPPVPVVFALAQFFLREGPGCSGHPAFPVPSSVRGQDECKTSGDRRRESADSCPLQGRLAGAWPGPFGSRPHLNSGVPGTKASNAAQNCER